VCWSSQPTVLEARLHAATRERHNGMHEATACTLLPARSTASTLDTATHLAQHQLRVQPSFLPASAGTSACRAGQAGCHSPRPVSRMTQRSVT